LAIERFGKYQVLNKIGQGAMGEVYRARDTALNRDVAVKTIQAGDSSDETLQKRFLREARSAAGLSHPNIITVYDFGQEHGRLYMAMELLEGGDLKKAIGDRSLRSLEQKLGIMEQIGSGLAFAHENGVVHRDLKPANVHLQPDGTVKVMDFGLAKVSGSDMTRSGMIMGTPHYMSPEQVRGEKADARSDVFSLGCIFYEIVTSSKPFDADSMHAVLFKVLQEEPAPIRQVLPNLPIVVAQVIEAALAKDPANRFPSAGVFLEALQAARHAIESGQGNRLLPGLPEPRPPLPGATSPSASVARGTAPRSNPPASASASASIAAAGGIPAALWVGVGLFVVVLAGVGFWMTSGGGEAPPVGPPVTAPTDTRMKMLAGTELEIARRTFAAGNHVEALKHATRAVSLDPQNADAKQLQDELKKKQAERVAAAKVARQASVSGDRKAAADALWTLMRLDPKDATVNELSPAVDAEFESHAGEARDMLAEAQKTAEQAGLKTAPEFRDVIRVVREAETAAQARKWATAAAKWLTARERFERLTRATP
jgi:tRNA A-37 threonylcarbamoyl transferase component Bud32